MIRSVCGYFRPEEQLRQDYIDARYRFERESEHMRNIKESFDSLEDRLSGEYAHWPEDIKQSERERMQRAYDEQVRDYEAAKAKFEAIKEDIRLSQKPNGPTRPPGRPRVFETKVTAVFSASAQMLIDIKARMQAEGITMSELMRRALDSYLAAAPETTEDQTAQAKD